MRVLVAIIQIVWGLPQTLLGFFFFLLTIRRKHYLYRCAVVTEWHRQDSCSLGLFIFLSEGEINKKETLKHEYGHCLQSIILGPMYLLIIGIPSFLWCNLPMMEKRRKRRRVSYYSFYTERWANRLADRYDPTRKDRIR